MFTSSLSNIEFIYWNNHKKCCFWGRHLKTKDRYKKCLCPDVIAFETCFSANLPSQTMDKGEVIVEMRWADHDRRNFSEDEIPVWMENWKLDFGKDYLRSCGILFGWLKFDITHIFFAINYRERWRWIVQHKIRHSSIFHNCNDSKLNFKYSLKVVFFFLLDFHKNLCNEN